MQHCQGLIDSAILWDVGKTAPLSSAENEGAVSVAWAVRRFAGPWVVLISSAGLLTS